MRMAGLSLNPGLKSRHTRMSLVCDRVGVRSSPCLQAGIWLAKETELFPARRRHLCAQYAIVALRPSLDAINIQCCAVIVHQRIQPHALQSRSSTVTPKTPNSPSCLITMPSAPEDQRGPPMPMLTVHQHPPRPTLQLPAIPEMPIFITQIAPYPIAMPAPRPCSHP